MSMRDPEEFIEDGRFQDKKPNVNVTCEKVKCKKSNYKKSKCEKVECQEVKKGKCRKFKMIKSQNVKCKRENAYKSKTQKVKGKPYPVFCPIHTISGFASYSVTNKLRVTRPKLTDYQRVADLYSQQRISLSTSPITTRLPVFTDAFRPSMRILAKF